MMRLTTLRLQIPVGCASVTNRTESIMKTLFTTLLMFFAGGTANVSSGMVACVSLFLFFVVLATRGVSYAQLQVLLGFIYLKAD